MKLIVEVTTRDDKTTKHVCVDFPAWASDFVTLYKEDFKRDSIKTETIQGVKQYFEK